MTKTPHQSFLSVMAAVLLVLSLALQTFFAPSVSAAQITSRKLTLQAGTTDGGSKPSGVVNHLFEFTLPSSGTMRSIKFEYCTTAADSPANPACVKPAGLTTTSATLSNESGATGFSIVSTTDGAPYITRANASVTGPQAVSYRLSTVTNPSTEGSFYVRITTYASGDTTGSAVDSGTVTASTAEQIVLDGTMPESLVFCAGETISKTAGVPDCSTATDGVISFNQLFSTTDTATAHSQMAASTNAGNGYAVTVNGPTLTSGSNTVTALATPNASVKGISQFGMNLRANTAAAAANFTNPGTSGDIDLTSNGTNLHGRPVGDYSTPDTFAFNPGAVVADSNYDATGNANPTDNQIYTISYIANVPGSQPAGTYVSTLTYICTPTF